jgi:SAM-dependent methyltransferase
MTSPAVTPRLDPGHSDTRAANSAGDVFARMDALSDPVRARLLLTLERQEFTVSELCSIVQLPQSTVSRHLKTLLDEGFVVSHAAGTSRRYRLAINPADSAAQTLWSLVRAQVSTARAAAHDARRIRAVLARRKTRSRRFFSTAAHDWDRVREELFGRRGDLTGLLGLLDQDLVVGDLGCGNGTLSEALAPFVARVIAVDASAEMLAAATDRLAAHDNVELREGELEALPLETDSLDAAMLVLVLPYLPEPGRPIAEAARVVKPGGRILIVDLMPHDREDYGPRLGHLWQGFSGHVLRTWLTDNGLEQVRYRPLPPDPASKGPTLFAATARVPAAAGDARNNR